MARKPAVRKKKMRNRVDEVLGFEAPLWVDEIVGRRRIDRRSGKTEDIEEALRAEFEMWATNLFGVLKAFSVCADILGFDVVKQDIDDMTDARLRDVSKADWRKFYRHHRDPRGELPRVKGR